MKKIAVIGGINMDISGKSLGAIIPFDSNIGKIKLSYGGVARNIAENIARLGVSVDFFSAFGNDMFGREILADCKALNIDTSHSEFMDHPTSTYLFVSDNQGEMQVAVNDMSIYDKITVKMCEKNLHAINECDYVVLDTNFPKEVLCFYLNNIKKPIIMDAVSIPKLSKVVDVLDKVTYFKPNRLEAEFLSGIKIVDNESCEKAAIKLVAKGIANVLITLGCDGVMIANKKECKIIPAIKTEVVNATGAGDSFVGGFTYGLVKGYDIKDAVKCGVATSAFTLLSEETVSKEMSEENLKINYKKIL